MLAHDAAAVSDDADGGVDENKLMMIVLMMLLVMMIMLMLMPPPMPPFRLVRVTLALILTFWDNTGVPDDAKMSQEEEPEDLEENKNKEIKKQK